MKKMTEKNEYDILDEIAESGGVGRINRESNSISDEDLETLIKAIKDCKKTFDWFRMVRGCDGALSDSVKLVDDAMEVVVRVENDGKE